MIENNSQNSINNTQVDNKTNSLNKKASSIKDAINECLAKGNNKIIIGNWKMNKLFEEIKTYCSIFNSLIRKDKYLKKTKTLIGIAPTAIGLLPTAGMMKNNVITVAQNISGESRGALTGQISFEQVREYNINYAIVGHSETREYLGVTNKQCNATINSLTDNDMVPILCVGDTLDEYKNKSSEKVIKMQLINCLKNLTEEQIVHCIIAYEPIWAIGAYSANNIFIKKIITTIRSTIASLYSKKIANDVHVLYGGSVNPENAESILAINGIDGVLVGGSSLDPNDFYKICISTPEYKKIKWIIDTKNGRRIKTAKIKDKDKIKQNNNTELENAELVTDTTSGIEKTEVKSKKSKKL